jgi:hypothetical protein
MKLKFFLAVAGMVTLLNSSCVYKSLLYRHFDEKNLVKVQVTERKETVKTVKKDSLSKKTVVKEILVKDTLYLYNSRKISIKASIRVDSSYVKNHQFYIRDTTFKIAKIVPKRTTGKFAYISPDYERVEISFHSIDSTYYLWFQKKGKKYYPELGEGTIYEDRIRGSDTLHFVLPAKISASKGCKLKIKVHEKHTFLRIRKKTRGNPPKK